VRQSWVQPLGLWTQRYRLVQFWGLSLSSPFFCSIAHALIHTLRTLLPLCQQSTPPQPPAPVTIQPSTSGCGTSTRRLSQRYSHSHSYQHLHAHTRSHSHQHPQLGISASASRVGASVKEKSRGVDEKYQLSAKANAAVDTVKQSRTCVVV
jgi:hypothetical protein